MSRIPEYQRKAVIEFIKNMENSISWHLDQVETLKQEIKKHKDFLKANNKKDV